MCTCGHHKNDENPKLITFQLLILKFPKYFLITLLRGVHPQGVGSREPKGDRATRKEKLPLL